ncbi:Ribonuclease VapC26 [Acaryochloris thomasi RCC1774]|uniref:Ribonuclease VapC26 n=1 Tax=Acaryochloris thomasi RCC1774 TaxID=1764569 RepID=A0A2W1JM22_9CYAN|nr:Ribonuclease VapC26 [Acaryochloris thomasi RCC1774]
MVKFLRGISASRFELIEATAKNINRAADILEQYADSKVDFVDASVMAIAERLNITTVLTIDRQDFSLFRPLHCQNFVVRP